MPVFVSILGATGVVGQKIIALLSGDPNYKIIELVASEQRVGQIFGDVCDWREPLCNMPDHVSSLKLVDAQNLKSDFVVSCLPGDIALELEPMLANQGKMVFSNASSFRMDPFVPLLVPEINSGHLSLLNLQKTKGKIITNPNCSAVGVTLALAPLLSLGEIEHVSVVTMQSVSGAGYPGVPSLDMIGNTIPYIKDEAIKITEETKKILGSAENHASFAVTSQVHRVPVISGHTVTLHVTFKDKIDPTEAALQYQQWNQKFPNLYKLHDKAGRPQAAKDIHHDDMRAHIGHLCQGDLPNVLNLVCLTHNLVRGAAGAVLTNMNSYLSYLGGKNV